MTLVVESVNNVYQPASGTWISFKNLPNAGGFICTTCGPSFPFYTPHFLSFTSTLRFLRQLIIPVSLVGRRLISRTRVIPVSGTRIRPLNWNCILFVDCNL
jgi:hypothetical protein